MQGPPSIKKSATIKFTKNDSTESNKKEILASSSMLVPSQDEKLIDQAQECSAKKKQRLSEYSKRQNRVSEDEDYRPVIVDDDIEMATSDKQMDEIDIDEENPFIHVGQEKKINTMQTADFILPKLSEP